MKPLFLARIQILVLLAVLGSASGCGENLTNALGAPNLRDNAAAPTPFTYIACEGCTDESGNCYADQQLCPSRGCTTGAHSSSSHKTICSMLNTPGINGSGCAAEERRKLFVRDFRCKGAFTDRGRAHSVRDADRQSAVDMDDLSGEVAR